MTQVRVHPVIEEVQKELRYHPTLKAELMAPGAVKSFEDGLAIMAAYVDLVLDGEYDGDDVVTIYEHLLTRLRDKRGAIAIIT
jgi:hypothetical protein